MRGPGSISPVRERKVAATGAAAGLLGGTHERHQRSPAGRTQVMQQLKMMTRRASDTYTGVCVCHVI